MYVKIKYRKVLGASVGFIFEMGVGYGAGYHLLLGHLRWKIWGLVYLI